MYCLTYISYTFLLMNVDFCWIKCVFLTAKDSHPISWEGFKPSHTRQNPRIPRPSSFPSSNQDSEHECQETGGFKKKKKQCWFYWFLKNCWFDLVLKGNIIQKNGRFLAGRIIGFSTCRNAWVSPTGLRRWDWDVLPTTSSARNSGMGHPCHQIEMVTISKNSPTTVTNIEGRSRFGWSTDRLLEMLEMEIFT